MASPPQLATNLENGSPRELSHMAIPKSVKHGDKKYHQSKYCLPKHCLSCLRYQRFCRHSCTKHADKMKILERILSQSKRLGRCKKAYPSRSKQVRDRLRKLKTLVPGGKAMNLSIFFLELGHYIRLLQIQIQMMQMMMSVSQQSKMDC